MLNVEAVTDETGVRSLEATWQTLVARSDRATPFQTWEWISSWLTHVCEGRPFVLVAREASGVVGLLALTVTRYRGAPFRQVRFMGAPLSDYQDQLTLPGREAECARAFFAFLAEARGRWDFCDLNDLREGAALLAGAGTGGAAEARAADGHDLADECLHRERVFHRKCPVITLGASFDAYLKGLGRNTRSNVGRRRRQLEKHFRAELVTLNGEAAARELGPAMDDLFRLHNTRWRRRGAAGAFSAAQVQAFHLEVARRFAARGWLRLHLLKLDGVTRGAFYCFQLGARVYYYLSGFDHAIGKFSPGNVLMAYAIERAIVDGAREFDLLRGDESYKYAWKAEDRETHRLIVGHTTWRSKLARSGHRLERFIEHEGLKVQRRLWGRRPAEQARGARPAEAE